MDIPITNPQINASLEDNSRIDDSFDQYGTTVNLGSGATYNQNCGNEHSRSNSKFLLFMIFIFSTICDIIIFIVCCALLNTQSEAKFKLNQFINEQTLIQKENENIYNRLFNQENQNYKELIHKLEEEHNNGIDRYNEYLKETQRQNEKTLSLAKEGTIWLLRDDMIKSMSYHNATKCITPKEYKRIKDEFIYYKQIGGNHDVEDRFDNFTSKIFGTSEIKMTNDISFKNIIY